MASAASFLCLCLRSLLHHFLYLLCKITFKATGKPLSPHQLRIGIHIPLSFLYFLFSFAAQKINGDIDKPSPSSLFMYQKKGLDVRWKGNKNRLFSSRKNLFFIGGGFAFFFCRINLLFKALHFFSWRIQVIDKGRGWNMPRIWKEITTYFFLDIAKREEERDRERKRERECGEKRGEREPCEADNVRLYRRVLQRETPCLELTSKIANLSIDASILQNHAWIIFFTWSESDTQAFTKGYPPRKHVIRHCTKWKRNQGYTFHAPRNRRDRKSVV